MLDKNNQKKRKNISGYLKQIDDEQKTKLWIKTLLSIQNALPEIIKSVDKIIEINASSLSFVNDIYNTEKSTFAQIEKENKLINIYLISKNLLSSIDEDDRLFLKRKYIFNWTAEELSIEYQVSVRTIFRRIEKLVEQIYEKTKKKNWSLKFITMQVKDEHWIQEKFYRFVKDNMPTSFNFEPEKNLPENDIEQLSK